MSSENAFERRRASLENQFFSEVDEKLLAKLRSEMAERMHVEALMAATGIKDREALKGLVRGGMTEDTVLALRIVPIVVTAWADGRIEDDEKKEVARIAASHGIHPDQPSGQLLRVWLETQPPEDLMANWEACTKDLVNSLTEKAAGELRHTIMVELRNVATSAGGLLGWSAISKGESDILHRAEAALTRAR